MKFTAEEEISAPIEHVFTHLADPERLERMVRQRGGSIARTPQGPLGVGTTWDADVVVRGASRPVTVTLDTILPPRQMRFSGGGAALDLSVAVDLEAVTPGTTRITVVTDAKPRSLAGRVMIQSLKLARGTILTRYRKHISDYAAMIERAHRIS